MTDSSPPTPILSPDEFEAEIEYLDEAGFKITRLLAHDRALRVQAQEWSGEVVTLHIANGELRDAVAVLTEERDDWIELANAERFAVMDAQARVAVLEAELRELRDEAETVGFSSNSMDYIKFVSTLADRFGALLEGVPAATPEPPCSHCGGSGEVEMFGGQEYRPCPECAACPTCGSADRAVRLQVRNEGEHKSMLRWSSMECWDDWHGGETPS